MSKISLWHLNSGLLQDLSHYIQHFKEKPHLRSDSKHCLLKYHGILKRLTIYSM